MGGYDDKLDKVTEYTEKKWGWGKRMTYAVLILGTVIVIAMVIDACA